MRARRHVAVVGAGPYGLAVTERLRRDGVSAQVFGVPMRFWRRHMPRGMLLRSPWVASHIGAARGPLSLRGFEVARGAPLPRPLPLADFVAYGEWFQRTAVADADCREVQSVERRADGYRLALEDGEPVTASHVVVATGIGRFGVRPAQFTDLGPEHVSHAVDHTALDVFAGRRVAVVGGGQSALESAALLHEAGAAVEVLVRGPRVYWLVRSARLHRLAPVRRLLYSPADIGPAGVSWIVSTPGIFRRIPAAAGERLAERSVRPAGAGWLVPRTREVRITPGVIVREAVVRGDEAELLLDDGSRRRVDHVLLATGYHVDLDACTFLDASLRRSIARANGSPLLDRGMQASVGGLYFVGAPAARTHGPLMRFVAGSDYAARAVAGSVSAGEPRGG